MEDDYIDCANCFHPEHPEGACWIERFDGRTCIECGCSDYVERNCAYDKESNAMVVAE